MRAAAGAAAPAVPADGTCVVERASCAATCRLAGCVVFSDAEVRCADASMARRSLRVAPSTFGTYVAAASDDETHVLQIGNGATGADIGAPISGGFNNPLLLAVDAAETLHAVGNDGINISHALYSRTSWSQDHRTIPTDYNAGAAALEIGPDLLPRVLLHTGPDEYTLARRNTDGVWMTDAPDAWQDFTLDAEGGEVRLRTVSTGTELLLEARAGGVILPGYPVPNSSDFRVTHGVIRALSGLPPFVVATYRDGALHLGGRDAASHADIAIPNTPLAQSSCATGHDATNCTGTCDTKEYGLQNMAFSLGRTDDGAAWLAYLATHVDITCHLGLTGSDGNLFCGCASADDRSVGELHLLRAPPDGSAPVEVLKLALEPQLGGDASDGLPLLHVRAYRGEVVVAARVRGADNRAKLRVITLGTGVFAD